MDLVLLAGLLLHHASVQPGEDPAKGLPVWFFGPNMIDFRLLESVPSALQVVEAGDDAPVCPPHIISTHVCGISCLEDAHVLSVLDQEQAGLPQALLELP